MRCRQNERGNRFDFIIASDRLRSRSLRSASKSAQRRANYPYRMTIKTPRGEGPILDVFSAIGSRYSISSAANSGGSDATLDRRSAIPLLSSGIAAVPRRRRSVPRECRAPIRLGVLCRGGGWSPSHTKCPLHIVLLARKILNSHWAKTVTATTPIGPSIEANLYP